MRVINKIKVLPQLSFTEGAQLVLGFIINRITGTSPSFISQDIFVMGDQMSHIIDTGNKIEKVSNSNIVTFNNTSVNKPWFLCLRRMTTDYNIYGQIFRFEEYKPLVDIVNRLKQKEIRYIIDAGANVGCSTIYFKHMFPEAKIVAIEPQSGNFDVLCKNIELNNMQQDVFAAKSGLWKDNSNLQITTDFRDGREYAFFLKTIHDWDTRHETVSGITITDIIEKYNFPHIDILKIDIEGSEKYLFENEEIARKTLGKVNFMALEIHDEVVDRKLVVSLLEKLGFEYENFHETLVAYRKEFLNEIV